MSGYESDEDMPLQRADSEKENSYNVVPKNIVFKLKFKKINGTTYEFFEYKLKKGNDLPYSTVVKGIFPTPPKILHLIILWYGR